MTSKLKVFVIPQARIPGGPPEPAFHVEVTAPSRDALRRAAVAVAATHGRVRSVSFSAEGLVAYVEEAS